MNPWEILGIDATSDKKLIKHAYAKALKKCNPEVNPEDFMQLRSAYEFILSFIKNDDTPKAKSTINKSQFKNVSPLYFEQKQQSAESNKQSYFDNILVNQEKENNDRKKKTLNEDGNLSEYLDEIVDYNVFVLSNKDFEAQALQVNNWKKEYQSLIDRLYQLLNDKTLISKTDYWNDLLSAPLITHIYRNQFQVDLVESIQSHILKFSETRALKPKVVALIFDYLQADHRSGDDSTLTDYDLVRISEVSTITHDYLNFKQQQTHLKFWLKQFVWLFFSFKRRLTILPYIAIMVTIFFSYPIYWMRLNRAT